MSDDITLLHEPWFHLPHLSFAIEPVSRAEHAASHIKDLLHYGTLSDWRLKNGFTEHNWGSLDYRGRARWACAQLIHPQSGLSEWLIRQHCPWHCHSDFHSDVTSTLLLPLSCGSHTQRQSVCKQCRMRSMWSFFAATSDGAVQWFLLLYHGISDMH